MDSIVCLCPGMKMETLARYWNMTVKSPTNLFAQVTTMWNKKITLCYNTCPDQTMDGGLLYILTSLHNHFLL